MWIYRRPLNSSKDHVTFLGGQKMCRKKPQKTAWIILESHGQDPIHGLQEKVSVSAWPKKEAKEFQPWVKLHIFLVSLPLVWKSFLREVLTPPLGGYGRPSLKKPWKLMAWKTILSSWAGIFSEGELLVLGGVYESPIIGNSMEFLQNASQARMQSSPLQWRITSFHGMPFWGGGSTPQHIISSFLDLRPTDPKCPAIWEVVSNHKNYHEAKLFLDRNEALLYTNTNLC